LNKSTEIQHLTDEELLQKYFGQRDQAILGQLLERYISFVLLIASKYLKDKDLAKDLSMQVFEKVINEVHRFEIKNFKSWLHVVTKNQCLMHLRSQKGHFSISIDQSNNTGNFVENETFVHHGYDEEKESRLVQLEDAVNQLDEEQRQCVQLFFIEEKSYKEITDTTGYTLNQVKSYIQNGKRNLRNILAENGNIVLYLLICMQLISK
jgi:RNA polymerase sigma factor (sigma-70 family)